MNKWKERRKGRWKEGRVGEREKEQKKEQNNLALNLLSWELGCKHDYGRENVEILP